MKNQPLLLTDKFTRAVDYARILHIERRKGTEIPFMAHLLGVASLVMGEAGHVPFPVTEDMVIAALLHDAVEDHGGLPRLEDVHCNFGDDVARMVEGLSDSFAEDPGKKKAGKSARRPTSNAFLASRRRLSSSPPPTSSTTPAPSSTITAYRTQSLGALQARTRPATLVLS